MRKILTIVGLLVISILLPVLSSCQEYPSTVPQEEYMRVWNENQQKSDEIQTLQSQIYRLEYKAENCQFQYDNLKEKINSLIPSIGTSGMAQGKLRNFYIEIGNNNNPLIRDKIHLYFESGLSVIGYGNFTNYSCIVKGYDYQICYQEIKSPNSDAEILIRIISIKVTNNFTISTLK